MILCGVLYLPTVSCFCRCLLLTLQLLPRQSLFVLLLLLLFLIGFDLVEYGRNELENDIARYAQTSVLNVADAQCVHDLFIFGPDKTAADHLHWTALFKNAVGSY